MEIQKENVNFGDYCSIEQKRYGAPNEFYGYKVIGRLRSNSWVDTPVDTQNGKPKLHSEIVDVVQVISCTAGCDVVEQFRVSDLTRAWQQAQKVAVPQKTETVYLVWNEAHNECVGFTDKRDAKYASTGIQTSVGYSTLAGEFREIYEYQMDGSNFNITEIQIEAQEN